MLGLRGPKLIWRASRRRPVEVAVETEVGAVPVIRAVKRDDGTGHRFVASHCSLSTYADSSGLYALRRQGRWSGDNHERSRRR
jgi:hypothetical protein